MGIQWWAWVGFLTLILGLLALDLFVFNRQAHEISFREATKFSIFWVSLGLAFGVVVWIWLGPQAGGEYFAGYLIEKSLSVDNIFVFALIFTYFSVPSRYQHRVLFWGIIGALVFRAAFIAGGAALLDRFHWTIYLFGAFLVFTGIRMAFHKNEEMHPEKNPILKLFRRFVRMTPDYRGQRLFVRENGMLLATPLMAVLVLIETTDILFAVDSIPAIFAITKEPFIVFTSNAFAILGLRALYFMLAGMLDRFVYLKVGLAAVLVFVGVKMLIAEWWHIPIGLSLAVIAGTIGSSVGVSLLKTRGQVATGGSGEALTGAATASIEGHDGAAALTGPEGKEVPEDAVRPEPGRRKVLLATDGQEHSQHAVDLVAAIADRVVTDIDVVSVNTFDAALAGAQESGHYDAASAHEAAAQAVEHVRATLAERGFTAQGRVLEGDANTEILRISGEEGFDLVVLGAGSERWKDNVMMGSTSTRVLHHARSSVLVAHVPKGPLAKPVRVLVATDGSTTADAAVEEFCLVADAEACALDLVAVADHDRDLPGAQEALGRLEEITARHGFSFTTSEVLRGHAVEQLLAAAADHDLVVVGATGSGRLAQALLGSVTDQVVRHAPATFVGRSRV